MIKISGKKTLYLSLLILIIAALGVGAGAAWHYYWKAVSYTHLTLPTILLV